MREVERSETRMQGQDLLVPFGGAGHPGNCQKGLAQQGETSAKDHAKTSSGTNRYSHMPHPVTHPHRRVGFGPA